MCPICDDREVIETATQFICPTRLKNDEIDAAWRAEKKEARARGEKAPKRPEKPAECGFVFPRTVCKREITRDEAQYYMANGKTELLTDFTSRFGRPFSATLVLKETGRHGFEFPPRGKAAQGEGKEQQSPATKKTTRKKTTRKKTTRKKTTRKKAAKAGTKKKAATKKKAVAKKATRKKSAARKRAQDD